MGEGSYARPRFRFQQWSFIHLIVPFLVFIYSFQSQQVNAAEEFTLYNSSDVGIAILTTPNFNTTLFPFEQDGSVKSTGNFVWFVQFYNSWCGHCQRFAPVWKDVAKKTLAWTDFVKLAVIDCADKQNSPICNHYEIHSFPTIQFLNPKTLVYSTGKAYTGPHTEVGVFHGIIDHLTELNFPSGISPFPSPSVAELWKTIPDQFDKLALIVDDSESSFASEVLLGVLSTVKYTTVRRVTNLNSAFLADLEEGPAGLVPQLWFLTRDGKKLKQAAFTGSRSSADYISAIFANDDSIADSLKQPHAERKAFELAQSVLSSGSVVESRPQAEHPLATKLMTAVDIKDLVTAMVYMFSMEVSTHTIITGEEQQALTLFIKSLVDFVPFPVQTLNPLQKTLTLLKRKKEVKHSEILEEFKSTGLDLENIPIVWSQCAGSQTGRRGYPCSLWMLFHTMTVNAYEKHLSIGRADVNALDPNTGVLQAVFGYVKYFFSCAECKENFLREANGLIAQTKVLSEREALLWLWKMHNGVNRRLAGDVTEDPAFPKLQFPTEAQCAACRKNVVGESIHWDEDKVFTFLRGFYADPSKSSRAGIRNPVLRVLAEEQEKELQLGQTNAGTHSNDTSAVRVYLIGVTFVGLCYAGYRHFVLPRRKTSGLWDKYANPRIKWM